MRSLATSFLGAALSLGCPVGVCTAAPAPASANALTEVSFTPRKDTLDFIFRGRDSLTVNDVSVAADEDADDVVNVRLEGVKVARRWVTMPDAQILRALLHPGKDANVAVLRIRMKSKVDPAAVDAVQIQAAEGGVRVIVPRKGGLAAAATQAPIVVAPVVIEGAKPAPAPVAVPVSAAAVPTPAPASALVVATPVSAAIDAGPGSGVGEPVGRQAGGRAIDNTLTPTDAPLTLDDTLAAADAENVVVDVGTSESTGVGAAGATILLLLGGGFFLWRKIRNHRPDGGTGRLIRPLGTHVLGPKQGLLLLDVAGEMVLLGTSDKGVQMLTKIEKAPKVEKASAPVAAVPGELDLLRGEAGDRTASGLSGDRPEPAPAAPKARLNVTERAQAAIAKARALAAARARPVNRFETADEDVTSDSLERAFFERADAHLAEAANEIEDDYEPRAESFFARLRRSAGRGPEESPEVAPEPETRTIAPVKAATPRVMAPTPPARTRTAEPAAPSAALNSDILRKIRALQGA